MFTSEVKYLGNLRTEATHLASGEKIITDAPVDNHGRGEAFSPTDLVATAFGSCMMTLMGIAANKHSFEMKDVKMQITKHMAPDPRRIAKIDAVVTFSGKNYTDKEKKILEHAALTCPVWYSLHPDIEKNVSFTYE